MAKQSTTTKATIKHVVKLTSQGGHKPKTSSMNRTEKRSYKKYQGQGR